jgi:hypothetical protein
MAKKARIIITLEYDTETLELTGDKVSDDDFKEVMIDRAYEDIMYYMRTDPLDSWADVRIASIAEKLTLCSRCGEQTKPENVASEPTEIPFCKDCVGTCRGCGTTDEPEELLEHGLCYSCCKDLDEQAEEEGFYK